MVGEEGASIFCPVCPFYFVILFWVCVSFLSFVFLFWVLWFCFDFCDSVLNFSMLLLTLWFCFGFYDSGLGFCDSVSGFCDSVLSFVILFWILRFYFRFCDSVLGFATFFGGRGGVVILFWVLRFCFVTIYHRKNAFRELKQRRQTATDNLTLQMQHTSSSLLDYVGSWPRLFKRWIAPPLG